MDITEAPSRLQSITVYTGWVVDSIAFSYLNYTGQKRSAGRWGGPGGDPHTVRKWTACIVDVVDCSMDSQRRKRLYI